MKKWVSWAPIDGEGRRAPARALVGAVALSAALLPTLAPLLAQTVSDSNLVVTALQTLGLDNPTTMAFLGADDFLVLEKDTGLVRRVVKGTLLPKPVLVVRSAGGGLGSERGLLGIAVQNGPPQRVFLYYTELAADGTTVLGNRVYRYDWEPLSGTLVGAQLLIDLPVDSAPHNGGVLALDASNRLYAVIGDLDRNGPLQNGPDSLVDDTGVILRVDENGDPAKGNPFTPYCSATTTVTCTKNGDCPAGQTCQTQVRRYYAYGIRNSFGLALDAATGALWDTENGPESYDEVNRVEPGLNSGWRPLMGPDNRDPQGTGDLWNVPGAGLTYSDPEFSWLNTVAPTAILFPVATSWGPAYDSQALVGDANNGDIYALPLNAARDGFALTGGLSDLVADTLAEQQQVRFGHGFGTITDLKVGPDHDVYAVSIFPPAIYRISGPFPVELVSFTIE